MEERHYRADYFRIDSPRMNATQRCAAGILVKRARTAPSARTSAVYSGIEHGWSVSHAASLARSCILRRRPSASLGSHRRIGGWQARALRMT